MIVVLASGWGCQSEDRVGTAAKSASGAKRTSTNKDSSEKDKRDKDEREASEDDRDRAAAGAESHETEKVIAPAPKSDEEIEKMRAAGEPKKGDDMRPSGEQAKSGDMRPRDDEAKSEDMRPSDSAEEERPAGDGDSHVEDKAPSNQEPTYYKDAKAIIDAKCAICHMPGGIAPIPFTTYKEVKPFTALMAIDVEGGVMPPWLPSDPPGKFVGDRRLTPQQKSTLLGWIKAGALEGKPSDEPPPFPLEGRRSLAQVDESLRMAEPFEPLPGADEYRCFVFDWPYEATKYVTALDIVPGNRQLVHHAIAYYVASDQVPVVRLREAEDVRPGFECFGGVGRAAWLTSYEPGGHADEIPGQVGFAIEPGAVMVLQLHYNTQNSAGTDASRIDFTLKDQVERVGNVQLIMDPRWPAGAMQIPMGEPDVVHTYTGRGSSLSNTMNYDILWVDMHMHALGSAGRIAIVRANGDVEDLLNIPAWDFSWQETFILREPVTLLPNDKLYVECHFDNTPEHQITVNNVRLQPRNVTWGERTIDEMCLGNVLIAPARDD
ncbi:MAG TPA: monooxygenase [Polyangiales bacterium]|nr:monooxygenase [Polyangiales bacterium]